MGKVKIVPDAGMFIKAFPYKHSCLSTKRVKVGINWATDRPEQRFGSLEEAQNKTILFFDSIRKVVDKYDLQIYLIDHLVKEARNYDMKAFLHSSVKGILKDRVHIMYDEVQEDLFPPFDYTAPMFADIYRQMDLAIGMRGHANIIPFGQNTPCIGLGTHNKVKWFLEQAGVEDLIILLNDDNKTPNAVDRVIGRVIMNSQSYKEKMANCFDELCKVKTSFINSICGILYG